MSVFLHVPKRGSLKDAADSLCGAVSNALHLSIGAGAAATLMLQAAPPPLGAAAPTVSPVIFTADILTKAAPVFSLTAPSLAQIVPVPLAPEQPAPAAIPRMTMGGFSIGIPYMAADLSRAPLRYTLENLNEPVVNMAFYLAEKAELDKALADCAAQAADCQPQVRAFGADIDKARRIKDPVRQLETVSAIPNILTRYDYYEETHTDSNLMHRTLLDVVVSGWDICDENARLTLYILEKLGYGNRATWVAENVFLDGVQQDQGHAVVEAEAGGKDFVLNNGQAPAIVSADDLAGIIARATTLEQPATQIDYSGQSLFASPGEVLEPVYEFNQSQAAFYTSRPHYDEGKGVWIDVPAEALKARAGAISLSSSAALHDPILLPILAARFDIADAVAQNAATAHASHDAIGRLIQTLSQPGARPVFPLKRRPFVIAGLPVNQ